MSQRPPHASPTSPTADEPVADRAGPVAVESALPRPHARVERGTRGLGAQAKQWRWRSGRELWGDAR